MANSTAPSSVPTWALAGACVALAAAFAVSLHSHSRQGGQQDAWQRQLAQEVATRTQLQMTTSTTSRADTAKRLTQEGFDVQFVDDKGALPFAASVVDDATFSAPHFQPGERNGSRGMWVAYKVAGQGAQAALVPTQVQAPGVVLAWVAAPDPAGGAGFWASWFFLLTSFALSAFYGWRKVEASQGPLLWVTQQLNAMAEGATDPLPSSTAGDTQLQSAVHRVREQFKSISDRVTSETSDACASVHQLLQLQDEVKGGLATMKGQTQEAAEVAGNMEFNLGNMAQAVEGTYTEVKTVANGADKVSAAVGAIAGSVVDMNDKVNACSSSAMQLSSTLAQVVSSGESAAQETAQAQEAANRAYEIMGRLQKSAEEIDNVIEVISAIAAKTNLLALNAAIEAASAGVSGSGFAVVAGEVKNLANQTAKATNEVMDNIEGIRKSTREAAVAIEEIVDVVDGVKETTDAIASAVSDQRTRADGMAAIIKEAVQSAEHINGSVTDIHDGVRTVAGSASEISTTVEELVAQLGEVSNDMAFMARNLSGVSGDMEGLSTQSASMHDATESMQARMQTLLQTAQGEA